MNITRRQYLKLIYAMTLTSTATAKALAGVGKPLPLDEYQGKVVLVDFWASWCVPCRRSFPWLNDISRQYALDGLAVIGVNLDEDRQDAEKFLSQYPVDFPIVFDPEGEYASHYSIQGMPSTLIFSRQGELVHRHVGFLTERVDEYKTALLKVLRA